MYRLIIIFIVFFCSSSLSAASSPLFTQLYQYAKFSDLAYSSMKKIQAGVAAQGYQLNQAKALAGYDVAYFIASDDKKQQQIISIRGSQNMRNAALDMSLQLVPEAHLGIRLHEGFASAAAAVYADIKPYLNSNYQINITGHSLGGAVAAILAMHLSIDRYSIGRVVTFAQPKITDMQGAKTYAYLNILRVTTDKDAVPLLPPFSFNSVSLSEIYWHVGDEILLYSGEQYTRLNAQQSILRAADLMMQMPDGGNIQAHKMTYYLRLLQSKLKQSIYRPYKSMANPLNWIF